MMTAFAENTLGMLYREKGSDGSWRGGAMLYLKNGLRSPLLAGAFALFCVLASFGIGNMSQCNSIAQGLYSSFGISSEIVGTVTAVLLGAVLLGGLKRLSRVTETLVRSQVWRSRRFARWHSIRGRAQAARSATA